MKHNTTPDQTSPPPTFRCVYVHLRSSQDWPESPLITFISLSAPEHYLHLILLTFDCIYAMRDGMEFGMVLLQFSVMHLLLQLPLRWLKVVSAHATANCLTDGKWHLCVGVARLLYDCRKHIYFGRWTGKMERQARTTGKWHARRRHASFYSWPGQLKLPQRF